MNLVECQTCGTAFWTDLDMPSSIAGGPCCFGHEVLDIERYPTQRAASKAYPAWQAAANAAMDRAVALAKSKEYRRAA